MDRTSNPREIEVIKNHLGPVKQVENRRLYSSYRAALNDARAVSGRNLLDGKMPTTGESAGSWLGALGYLALLDHIGSCFKPVDMATNKKDRSGIIKALKYFSELEGDEIDAIYALRCSFAHNYSLSNIGISESKKRKDALTHRFMVHGSQEGPIVHLRKKQWDGKFRDKNPDNVTYISLVLLGNLVEEICTKIFALASSDKLEITLDEGYEELEGRFSVSSLI